MRRIQTFILRESYLSTKYFRKKHVEIPKQEVMHPRHSSPSSSDAETDFNPLQVRKTFRRLAFRRILSCGSSEEDLAEGG
jgi:hypothetical protein